MSASWPAYRLPRDCYRAATPTTRSSPAPTIVPTIGTARRSTWEKHSAELTLIPGLRPRVNSPRLLRPAYRRRNLRCAGLSTSPASQQLFPAPVARSRLATMPRWMRWIRLTQLFEHGLPSFMIDVFDHLCTRAGSVRTFPNLASAADQTSTENLAAG